MQLMHEVALACAGAVRVGTGTRASAGAGGGSCACCTLNALAASIWGQHQMGSPLLLCRTPGDVVRAALQGFGRAMDDAPYILLCTDLRCAVHVIRRYRHQRHMTFGTCACPNASRCPIDVLHLLAVMRSRTTFYKPCGPHRVRPCQERNKIAPPSGLAPPRAYASSPQQKQ